MTFFLYHNRKELSTLVLNYGLHSLVVNLVNIDKSSLHVWFSDIPVPFVHCPSWTSALICPHIHRTNEVIFLKQIKIACTGYILVSGAFGVIVILKNTLFFAGCALLAEGCMRHYIVKHTAQLPDYHYLNEKQLSK